MQILLLEYLEYMLLEVIDAVSVLLSDKGDAGEVGVVLLLLFFHEGWDRTIEVGRWYLLLSSILVYKLSEMGNNLNTDRSLSFVNQERYFFVVEIDESIFLVHGMAAEIISHEHMPVWLEIGVQVFLQSFSNLA